MNKKIFAPILMMILPSFSPAAVELFNGGYVYRLQINAPSSESQNLPLTIQYRSRSVWATNLGFGWCADWTTQLEPLGDRRYRLRDCSGDLIFSDQSSPLGEGDRLLSRQGDELKTGLAGLWVFRRDGARLKFSRNGLLLERYNQNKIERFSYDGFDRLRQWQRSDFSIEFSYQGLQREARSLRVSGGKPILFTQRLGNLESVEMNGPTMYFEYDDLNNLNIIREGRLELERINYLREQDLVKSISNTSTHIDLKYRRQPDGSYAVDELVRQIGKQRVVYSYKSDGLLSKIQDASSQILFNYNQSARLTQVTTARGEKIDLVYDDRGRLQSLSTQNKNGESLAATTALQGALDQLAPFQGGLVL